MSRRLTDSEIIEQTLGDSKVCDALEDAILAISIYGEAAVKLDHLKSVIASRLFAHQHAEIEREGLDDKAS